MLGRRKSKKVALEDLEHKNLTLMDGVLEEFHHQLDGLKERRKAGEVSNQIVSALSNVGSAASTLSKELRQAENERKKRIDEMSSEEQDKAFEVWLRALPKTRAKRFREVILEITDETGVLG